MSLGVWLDRSNANEAAAINAMSTACRAVSDQGVILAVASGNEYQDIDNPGGYLFESRQAVGGLQGMLPYPATFSHPNMITVSAINSSYRRPDFANYSPRTCTSPPPVKASGAHTTTADTQELDGTSMATPYVAGAAALLAAAFPSESAGQIRSRILGNVTKTSNLSGIVASGGYLDLDGAVKNEQTWDGGDGGGGGCSAAARSHLLPCCFFFPWACCCEETRADSGHARFHWRSMKETDEKEAPAEKRRGRFHYLVKPAGRKITGRSWTARDTSQMSRISPTAGCSRKL